MRSFVSGLAAALLLASGCSTYAVHRSILAPPIAPPLRSGQPLDGPAQFSIGSSTAISATTPTSSGNDGDWIPSFDLNGAARLRLGRDLDMGFMLDSGFNQGATAPSGGPRPTGNAWGAGISMAYSREIAPEWRLMFDAELMLYSLPFVEYDNCVSNCNTGEPYAIMDTDPKSQAVGSLAIIPSWHRDRVTLFGGLTIRNHPTVTATAVTVVPGVNDGIDAGPAYVIGSVGAEVTLAESVKALAMIYLPFTDDPIQYGPTLALSLSFDLPNRPIR